MKTVAGGLEADMPDVENYSVGAIVLFLTDSQGTIQLPAKRLAIISSRDFDALWEEIGIDAASWSPDIRHQAEDLKDFPYPQLYAIQNYIVYEYICSFDGVAALLAETAQARQQLHSPESIRALEVLVTVASEMVSVGRGGICFRPGITSYPETHVIP